MKRVSKARVLKVLDAAVWLGAGVLATYMAIAVLYPARVLDGAWRERLRQSCDAMKPRCQSLSFAKTRINDYWLGSRVQVRAPGAHAAAVRDALAGASGDGANRYVEWAVVPIGPAGAVGPAGQGVRR